MHIQNNLKFYNARNKSAGIVENSSCSSDCWLDDSSLNGSWLHGYFVTATLFATGNSKTYLRCLNKAHYWT